MSLSLPALLAEARVLPVVTIERAEQAAPLARALRDGGLTVIEVTLRTPAALAAIEAIARDVPDCVVGAGTVLTANDLARARDAGAQFAVSPGMSAALLTAERALPWLPGVATASDVMNGLAAGLETFKFFPAEAAGGPALLRALHGPFPHVKFCPTGGVNSANLASYRALANVICVGGSWMVDARAAAAGRWADVTAAARAA